MTFRDKYAWNQNFEDVDIVVPTEIKNTKMVSVIFVPFNLAVRF